MTHNLSKFNTTAYFPKWLERAPKANSMQTIEKEGFIFIPPEKGKQTNNENCRLSFMESDDVR
jgi:hypothetical protein